MFLQPMTNEVHIFILRVMLEYLTENKVAKQLFLWLYIHIIDTQVDPILYLPVVSSTPNKSVPHTSDSEIADIDVAETSMSSYLPSSQS